MKKVLFASTALAALGLGGVAQAADPIKLELGGYTRWWFGAATQAQAYKDATNTQPNTFSAQGDSEIYFKGATTLDNGLKVSLQVQLEAGGGQIGGGGQAQSILGNSWIDESYVVVGGKFGTLIGGLTKNGAYKLHVSAPDATGQFEEGAFLGHNQWVVIPNTVTYLDSTAVDTVGNAPAITYVLPSFVDGLTLGGSFIPDGGCQNQASVCNTTANGLTGGFGVSGLTASQLGNPIIGTPISIKINDVWGVAANYTKDYGKLGVKLSTGYVSGRTTATSDHSEWSSGAQLSFAGFSFGGGYRLVNETLNSTATSFVKSVLASNGATAAQVRSVNGKGPLNGSSWSLGAGYETGPYAVSLDYFSSRVEGNPGGGQDTLSLWQLGGKYALGPGVDVLGIVGYEKAQNGDLPIFGGAGSAGTNSGWAGMTGLQLTF